MATTQSGYSVVRDYSDPLLVSNPAVPGTNSKVRVYGGLRVGDPGLVLLYVLARFHREVEPLKQESGVWGFGPRTIVGGDGSTWSNHAGGVAVDANAARHPRGSATFTAGQTHAIRQIVADLSGIVDWGGEWTGATKDEMHVQLHGDIAFTGRVAKVAKDIRDGRLRNVPAELRGGQVPAAEPQRDRKPIVIPVPPDQAPPFPLPQGFTTARSRARGNRSPAPRTATPIRCGTVWPCGRPGCRRTARRSLSTATTARRPRASPVGCKLAGNSWWTN